MTAGKIYPKSVVMMVVPGNRKRRWLQIGLMSLPAIIVMTPLLALMVVGMVPRGQDGAIE